MHECLLRMIMCVKRTVICTANEAQLMEGHCREREHTSTLSLKEVESGRPARDGELASCWADSSAGVPQFSPL